MHRLLNKRFVEQTPQIMPDIDGETYHGEKIV